LSVIDPIVTTKELEEAYRPTLLFEIQLSPTSSLFLTTPSNGDAPDQDNIGVIFNTRFHNSAIIDQRIGGLQSAAGLGVDAFGAISIDISDANGRWYAHEMVSGFGGATMIATFAFFDPDTNLFSSESQVIFHGQCDPAQHSGTTLTINAVSTYSLTKQIFPPMPISRQCVHFFPQTNEQRQAAAANVLSIYFGCGYSPFADDNAFSIGNLDGAGQPFTSCSYDKPSCQQRGMYSSDAFGRYTSRFSGSDWVPPASWIGHSFTAGHELQGVNNPNFSKYQGYWPITFGNTWVNGVNANDVGDPNSTRGEVVIGCFPNDIGTDWVNRIPLVVTQGLLTPHESQTSDLLFRWVGLRDGVRSGGPTSGPIYSGNGNPYGSLVVIMPIVYQEVASSASSMDVKALVTTRPLPVYSDASNFSFQRTDLLAWAIYDIFRICSPELYARIDVQSVIDYAFVCGEGMSYRKSDGTTSTHRRFGVSLCISKEMSVAQLVEGLKLAGRLMIVPDITGQKLRFVCRQGLADQQQFPVSGSNDNHGYSSYRRTDNSNGSPTGTGYVAYSFDESNIIRNSLKITSPSIQTLPVVMRATLQDEDNNWNPDTISVASVAAYDKVKQKAEASIGALGLPNYDQAYRVGNSKLAELWTGNERGDWTGSKVIQFSTSFRGIHLTLGSIIRVGYRRLGLAPRFYRVDAISPSRDCRTLLITARWHEDRWFCDNFGQN
jgi:hypothetical protein